MKRRDMPLHIFHNVASLRNLSPCVCSFPHMEGRSPAGRFAATSGDTDGIDEGSSTEGID